MITLDEKDDAQVIFETLIHRPTLSAKRIWCASSISYRAMRNGKDADTLMSTRWTTFEEAF